MKKLIHSRNVFVVGKLCAVMLFVMLLCSSAWASSEPWDGTVGTLPTPEGNVYTISTPQELAAVAQAVNSGSNTFRDKVIVLANNIDLNNYEWTPIGVYTETPPHNTTFYGKFDGNGKTISGLKLSKAVIADNKAFCGLFGEVSAPQAPDEDAKIWIKDLTVSGEITINSIDNTSLDVVYVSGIAAYSSYVDFIECTSNVTIDVTFDGDSDALVQIGGITTHVPAMNWINTIKNCNNYGTIRANTDVKETVIGGIVSRSHSFIDNCINYGDITVYTNRSQVGEPVGWGRVGGIVGYLDDDSITRSINYGDIQFKRVSRFYAGGVAGAVSYKSRLFGCVNSGSITELQNVDSWEYCYIGGIVCDGGTSTHDKISINSCVNTGNLIGYDSAYIGGVIAEGQGTITNSKNSGALKQIGGGAGTVCGIAANFGSWRYDSSIVNCINEGNIESGYGTICGIVSGGRTLRRISNCTVRCSITTERGMLGGIAIGADNIEQCAFIGAIKPAPENWERSTGIIAGAPDNGDSITACRWFLENDIEIPAIGNDRCVVDDVDACDSLNEFPMMSIVVDGYNGVLNDGVENQFTASSYPISHNGISYLWSTADDTLDIDNMESSIINIVAREGSEGESSLTLNAVHDGNALEVLLPVIVLKTSASSTDDPVPTPTPEPEPEPEPQPQPDPTPTPEQPSTGSSGGGGGCNAGFGFGGLFAFAGLAVILRKSVKR